MPQLTVNIPDELLTRCREHSLPVEEICVDALTDVVSARRDKLLGPLDLSVRFDVPLSTIYRWRSQGSGPPSFRVGKYIRYRPDEVNAWVAEREKAR